jgi:predicted MFS family arabinose efflux permease
MVYAYDHGGAAAAGVVGLAVMLPAGLVAPLAGILVDRGRRKTILAAASFARGLLFAAAAAGMLLSLPLPVVVATAALASIPGRVFFPAQIAMLPRLTRSDEELVAATALGGGIENLGTVAGPAIAGAVLLTGGPAQVIGLCAGAMVVAGLFVTRVAEPGQSPASGSAQRPHPARDLVAGLQTVVRTPTLRLVISIYAFQTAVWGALSVAIVELALSELQMGDSGVGLLNGALGVGGVAGGLLAVGVSQRLRLGSTLSGATLLWGAALVILAVVPRAATPIVALLIVVGIGNVLVDVASYALIQRATCDEFRGRVFATLEGAAVGAVALGALAGGSLVGAIGAHATLAASGISLAASAFVTWQGLERADAGVAVALKPAVDTGSA